MENNKNGLQVSRQHDENIFREGEAIFSQDDLRELINYTYAEYQYKGSQLDKLVKFMDYLSQESHRFITPELTNEAKRLGAWLDSFLEFFKNNFHPGKPDDEGDMVYVFQTLQNSSEVESFLTELQMVAVDVEKAYRNYRAVVKSKLQI